MFEVKGIQEEAAKELLEERKEVAKKKVKAKLKQIEDAKLIVRNLERELDDIYAELAQ